MKFIRVHTVIILTKYPLRLKISQALLFEFADWEKPPLASSASPCRGKPGTPMNGRKFRSK